MLRLTRPYQAAIVAILLVLALSGSTMAGGLRVEPVIIETGDGPVEIAAEIADTPKTRQHGLMFRDSLGWNEGMLFDFKQVQPVTFWMKDTPLFLDMLFVDAGGVIVGVLDSVPPYTTDSRRSPGPVKAVLELRGGAAQRFGITKGDRLRHPIFNN